LSNSNEDYSRELSFIYELLKPKDLKKIFYDDFIAISVDETSKDFDKYFSEIYFSWVDSLRLQKNKDHLFVLCLIKAYLLIYLPRFFRVRDGDLSQYPKDFNGFLCPYFVSMNARLASLVSKDEEAPITLIDFIKGFGSFNEWAPDTTYTRILKLDNFFDYVEKNSSIIPNSKVFLNTVSSENYPKISRRIHSNKKPIPRQYFSLLISIMYSLEYMVSHINGMNEGVNPGVLKGEIVSPKNMQLEYLNVWRDLWGRHGSNRNSDNIPYSLLNYTPIVNFDGKLYPLETCKRFYTFSRYVKDGIEGKCIPPHSIRNALLMCETGIRKQHLDWLDLDRFDNLVDDSNRLELEPLLVSTDKRHGEWISIVSRRAIDICRRQKDWYEQCGISKFDEKLWYGGTEGSKFGKFRPLFRINETNVNSSISRVWPYILWTLQEFIQVQLGDYDTPELVRLVETNKNFEDGISVYENFDTTQYNLRSRTTPHGVRVTFVKDKIEYLPASIVGEHFTGQSTPQVHYYNVTDIDSLKSHGELLVDRFKECVDNCDEGVTPEIAELALKINTSIMNSVTANPELATLTHGLISLSDHNNDENGVGILKEKKYTKLAFNNTHICPFDNTCPAEVLNELGHNRPCSSCRYAIRSPVHLPAISAAKDRAYELVIGLKGKIDSYKKLPNPQKSKNVLEELLEEYDYASNDAFSLEFTERQLFEMYENGHEGKYLVKDSEVIKKHFQRVKVSEGDYIIKRLLDINYFPTLDSEVIQAKFAFVRKKLLVMSGDIKGLLTTSDKPESVELVSLIKSIMAAKGLSVADVFALAKQDINSIIGIDSPLATKGIMFSSDEKNEG